MHDTGAVGRVGHDDFCQSQHIDDRVRDVEPVPKVSVKALVAHPHHHLENEQDKDDRVHIIESLDLVLRHIESVEGEQYDIHNDH